MIVLLKTRVEMASGLQIMNCKSLFAIDWALASVSLVVNCPLAENRNSNNPFFISMQHRKTVLRVKLNTDLLSFRSRGRRSVSRGSSGSSGSCCTGHDEP
jgi:hypothetical protein